MKSLTPIFAIARLVPLLLIAGCSGSPTSPTPTPTPTPACAFTVGDGPGGSVSATAVDFTVSVATTPGCAWTATSQSAFITAAQAGGSGSGAATFTVAANSGGTREGSVIVAGRTLTVSQSAFVPECRFSVSPTQMPAKADGDDMSVVVKAVGGSDCPWTATTDSPFLRVERGASGTGDGIVELDVLPNDPAGPARDGTATVAGTVITITQAAGAANGCTYEFSTTHINAPGGGGTSSVNVRTSGNTACPWTATSDSGFISIVSSGSGAGNGTISIAVSPNTGAARSGKISLANQTLTVSQAAFVPACEYAVSPNEIEVGDSGGDSSVAISITRGSDCSWTATSGSSFIRVKQGISGSGPGTVELEVLPNATSAAARVGTATVAGTVVTVRQRAGSQHGCTFDFSPPEIVVPAAGGTFTGTVVASGNTACSWTAVSNSSFVSLVGNSAGTGNGTLSFAVLPNNFGVRSGSISVANRTLTIQQSAVPGPVAMLSFRSDRGDYIGQGQSARFDLGRTQFQVTLDPSQSRLNFTMPGTPTWWSLDLKAPSGPLVPGLYNYATRYPFQLAGVPGLAFGGSGRGCNRLTGRFLVATAIFSGTEVIRFHARFQQHCEGDSAGLEGEIWIDTAGGPPPALPDFPSAGGPTTFFTFSSDPGDPVGGGGAGTFTLTGWKFTANASSDPRAVEIRLLSTDTPVRFWNLNFAAASGAPLQPGVYHAATRYSFTAAGHGLSVSSNNACSTLSGAFTVHEITYGPSREILRFHATFEQHCGGAGPALRGEIRIVADPWR